MTLKVPSLLAESPTLEVQGGLVLQLALRNQRFGESRLNVAQTNAHDELALPDPAATLGAKFDHTAIHLRSELHDPVRLGAGADDDLSRDGARDGPLHRHRQRSGDRSGRICGRAGPWARRVTDIAAQHPQDHRERHSHRN